MPLRVKFLVSVLFLQVWFTNLPPILMFGLSRFKFNAALSQTEKIHKKLDFPDQIFMDRFDFFSF